MEKKLKVIFFSMIQKDITNNENKIGSTKSEVKLIKQYEDLDGHMRDMQG